MATLVLIPFTLFSCKQQVPTSSEVSGLRFKMPACNPNDPDTFAVCNPTPDNAPVFLPGVTKIPFPAIKPGSRVIPGSFGSVYAELIAGKLKNANLTCLNQAMTDGSRFSGANTSDAYVLNKFWK
ncbi:MAG: hypothetical protein EOP04_00345 [Proteobacteria bacterium]|nr:MAG: hypothetical protein EOP04_00345 [Pseudomonadota bacterium]